MREIGGIPLPVSLRFDLSQRHAGELQGVLFQDLRRGRGSDGVVKDLFGEKKEGVERDE